jgi:signal transduction histidine kinase/CheY-like chemotaxis protein
VSDRDTVNVLLDRTFHGAGRASCEVEFLGGEAAPIQVQIETLLSVDGTEVGVTVFDITERKRAEKALLESHALLENLAERVPGVIYQYRLYPDGLSSFPYSSPGICDIYEVTPAEVQEDAAPVFARLHPEDHDRVAAAIVESARALNLFYCEYRVVLPRQGLRWRLCEARAQRMEDGGTLWHGIITDTTAQREAEEERNRLQEELAQSRKMELVGQLAGGVAHDFNNMLGVICGQAELGLGQCEPGDPLYHGLTEILEAARRSAELTRQLLAFARKQVIMPKILDLNEAVSGFLKMLQRLVGEAIRLDWRPGENLWLTKMDASQMDQILLNLCLNAQDALGKVGAIRIETGNRTLGETYCAGHAGCAPGDYVMLSVSDDGCGMDQETMSHVFEPFFTTKKLGQGTGLGLATVYGAVKQNHGYIGVDSAPGKGTTFTLYLPRYEGPAALAAPEVEVKAPMPGAETLLVVEDEPALLKLNTMLLEKLGYTVLPASTPDQALHWAREYAGQIHLLVTDVVMPQMNGRDLVQELRSRAPHLRCLFMSGYTADIILDHGVLPEGVSFIQKPFTVAALAAKVREVLGSG